jgi:hypothetical protein
VFLGIYSLSGNKIYSWNGGFAAEKESNGARSRFFENFAKQNFQKNNFSLQKTFFRRRRRRK